MFIIALLYGFICLFKLAIWVVFMLLRTLLIAATAVILVVAMIIKRVYQHHQEKKLKANPPRPAMSPVDVLGGRGPRDWSPKQ